MSLEIPILRTVENKPGTEYDALNTKRLYAEDFNTIGDALDNHEGRLQDLEAGGGSGVVVLTDGANVALDASLGDVFDLVAAGNRTIDPPSNPSDGKKIIIRHFASSADRTLSLSSSAFGFRFGSDITALSATSSGKYDYIGCIYNQDDGFWDVVSYIKGF